jgi:hypothetical protein
MRSAAFIDALNCGGAGHRMSPEWCGMSRGPRLAGVVAEHIVVQDPLPVTSATRSLRHRAARQRVSDGVGPAIGATAWTM